MERVSYPTVTTTAGLSAFDLNNHFRVPQWDEMADTVQMRQIERDPVLLTIMDSLKVQSQVWTNPLMRWRTDERMDAWTQLAKAVSAADTYISVSDSYVVRAGYGFSFPVDGESVIIVDVDDDLSEGWTNGAGDACNVRIDRAKFNGANSTKVIGDYAYALPPYMAELSEPREGTTTRPGDPVYNLISLVSSSFNMSKYQLGSKILGGWGQLPKAVQDTVFNIRQQQQYGLLFQPRSTWDAGDEKQMYIGQGLMHYCQSNVLDLGSLGNMFSWPILNDFLVGTFESRLSGSHKELIAGPRLFSDALKFARDVGRLQMVNSADTYFDEKLGVQSFDITTDEGDMVTVRREKWSLSGALSQWGFLIDREVMGSGEYEGLGAQWFQNIQSNRSVLLREDAYLMSYALNVFDEKSIGVIRGGPPAIVTR